MGVGLEDGPGVLQQRLLLRQRDVRVDAGKRGHQLTHAPFVASLLGKPDGPPHGLSRPLRACPQGTVLDMQRLVSQCVGLILLAVMLIERLQRPPGMLASGGAIPLLQRLTTALDGLAGGLDGEPLVRGMRRRRAGPPGARRRG